MTNNSAIANVRPWRDDLRGARFQNAAMAKRPRKPRLDQYQALREASGWYLAAWRDFAGMTLEDLAEAAGTSKGMVSDLETGALNAKGERAQRFNRDWVDKFAAAIGTTGGFLIDRNPFDADPTLDAWQEAYRDLSSDQRELAIKLVRQLKG